MKALYSASKSVAKVEKRAYRQIAQEGNQMQMLQQVAVDEKEAQEKILKLGSQQCDEAIDRF